MGNVKPLCMENGADVALDTTIHVMYTFYVLCDTDCISPFNCALSINECADHTALSPDLWSDKCCRFIGLCHGYSMRIRRIHAHVRFVLYLC